MRPRGGIETLRRDRFAEEIAFHDRTAAELALGDILVTESFESPAAPENQEALRLLGNLRGLDILDLGCGTGEASVYLSMQGARVWSLDISTGMLRVARDLGRKHRVELRLLSASASLLPFADALFDVVYGYGVLHHVPLEETAQEVARVLKPGGRAFFIDPLAYNPLIEVYRRLARAVRSPGEKPLRFRDIRLFKRHFSSVTHKEFWFLALAIFLYYFLVERRHPGKTRYWKQILKDAQRIGWAFRLLHRVDRAILILLPFLRPLCWNTLIMLRK